MSFEHLDDPQPFQISADLRAGVEQRGRHLRRRRRAGVAATAVVAAFALVVGAGAAYGMRQAGRVQRVDTAESLTPVESLDEPFTVLLVGTDNSESLDGRPPSTNTDTMLLVRVDPVANRIGMVSLPRDLWVTLPQGRQTRLNAAQALGGPELLIDTIEANLGVAVNHYVQIDMDGLRDLVDELGGIDVNATVPLRDDHTGMELDAGCQTLDGDGALALVRSRYVEMPDSAGRWLVEPRSDLARIDRQQEVLLIALQKLQSQALDPLGADRLANVLLQHTLVDDTLTVGDLIDMAQFLHGVPIDSISRGVVPATGDTIGGASVLLATPDAVAQVRTMLDGPSDQSSAPPVGELGDDALTPPPSVDPYVTSCS